MKAVRYHARRCVSVDEIDEPMLLDGWSLVAPVWSGICGTDVKHYNYGLMGMMPESQGLAGAQSPFTLGHEFAGVVRATTCDDGAVVEGQRVAVDAAVKCGRCWYCQHGHPFLCVRGAILGLSADGGLAELVAVPTYALHQLPDGVTDEEGALVEPVAVAVHAMRRVRFSVGEAVCIVGGGVIGLCILMVAKAAGARIVAVIEPLPERRDMAMRLGADMALPPTDIGDQVALQEICDLFGGIGADVGFVCVGTGLALQSTIDIVRRGGRIGLVGGHLNPAQVDITHVIATQKELIGTVAYEEDFPRAIALIADRRVDPRPLVTARVDLDNAVTDGLEELVGHPERQIKILVRTQLESVGSR